MERMRVGVIGAGAISGRYITTIQQKFPELEVCTVAARHLESARTARELARLAHVPAEPYVSVGMGDVAAGEPIDDPNESRVAAILELEGGVRARCSAQGIALDEAGKLKLLDLVR